MTGLGALGKSSTSRQYAQMHQASYTFIRYIPGYQYKRKALATREELFERMHPEVAESFRSVETTFEKLGRKQEAQKFNEKAEVIEEETREKIQFATLSKQRS